MEGNASATNARMFPPRDDVKKMSAFSAIISLVFATLAMTVCGLAMSTAKTELLTTEKIGGIAAVVPLLPIGIGLSATMFVMHRRLMSVLSLLASLCLMLVLEVDYATSFCLFGAFAAGTLTLVYFSVRPTESRFKRVGTVAVVFCAGYILWLVISIKNGYGNMTVFVDTYMAKATAAMEESFNILLSQMSELAMSERDITFIVKQMYLSIPSYLGVIALWTGWFAEFIVMRAHTVFGGERILAKPQNTTIPVYFAVIYIISILAQLLLPASLPDGVFAVTTAAYTVTMLPCAAAGFTMVIRGLKRMRRGTKIAIVVLVLLFGVGFLVSLMAAYGAYAVIGNSLRAKMKKSQDNTGTSDGGEE